MRAFCRTRFNRIASHQLKVVVWINLDEKCIMKRAEFERMDTDDLWSLHVKVSQLLQQKIQQEKLQLEERLKQLQIPV